MRKLLEPIKVASHAEFMKEVELKHFYSAGNDEGVHYYYHPDGLAI